LRGVGESTLKGGRITPFGKKGSQGKTAFGQYSGGVSETFPRGLRACRWSRGGGENVLRGEDPLKRESYREKALSLRGFKRVLFSKNIPDTGEKNSRSSL